MQKLPALAFGKYYHIYNRGINRGNIFFEDRNYAYFLELYARHVEPVAQTFAYCLMANHFHLLVRIKLPREQTFEVSETSKVYKPIQQFSNFLNAYAKAINKAYQRTGSLFEGRFGRIEVKSNQYFARLVHYIHFNPQRHGFVQDFRAYPYSSYDAFISNKTTRLQRDVVLAWFNGVETFEKTHQQPAEEKGIFDLIGDDE